MKTQDEIEVMKKREKLLLEANNLFGMPIQDVNKIMQKVRDLEKDGKLRADNPDDNREWVRSQAKRLGYRETPMGADSKYQKWGPGEFQLLTMYYNSKWERW